MKKGLSFVGKVVLAVGMFLYLGKHSLNFFSFTFQGEDVIYSYLGLLTTSGGALIWMGIFMWQADHVIEKTTAFVMMIVSLLGEFAVAGFDMFMNATGQLDGKNFTPDEVRAMVYVVAGLALLHGLALVIDIVGEEVARVWTDVSRAAPAKQVAPTTTARGLGLPLPSPTNTPVNREGGEGFID